MSALELGKAVDKVLIATKKTRRMQRKKKEASENYTWECEPLTPGVAEEKPESKETIALALRKPGAGSQSPFTMDDLRIKYSEFSTNFGITEKDAPALFAYLSKKEKMKRSRSGLGMTKTETTTIRRTTIRTPRTKKRMRKERTKKKMAIPWMKVLGTTKISTIQLKEMRIMARV